MRLWIDLAHLSEGTSEQLKKYIEQKEGKTFTFDEIQQMLSSYSFRIRQITHEHPSFMKNTERYHLIKYNYWSNKYEEFAPLYPDENGVIYEVSFTKG